MSVSKLMPDGGGKLARRGYERCLDDFGTETGFTLRQCLQQHHDRHM